MDYPHRPQRIQMLGQLHCQHRTVPPIQTMKTTIANTNWPPQPQTSQNLDSPLPLLILLSPLLYLTLSLSSFLLSAACTPLPSSYTPSDCDPKGARENLRQML